MAQLQVTPAQLEFANVQPGQVLSAWVTVKVRNSCSCWR